MVTATIANGDTRIKHGNRYYPNTPSPRAMYTRGMKLRLKELRLSKGMTQTQVAKAAGLSQSYYTELELGRKQINANRLEALARVLGVQPAALIEGTTTNPAHEVAAMLEALTPDEQALVLNLVRSLNAKK